jgi:exonuclease VII small subunit
MSNYTLSDYEAAKKSLSSTLRKIEKAIVSLEEKQAEGKNLKAQITLSKERVKALSISLDLIEKEIISLTKI